MTYLEKLKQLALAATQKWKDAGDWSHDHNVGFSLPDADAEFIAAFSPATALILIERIENLRAELKVACVEIWALSLSENLVRHIHNALAHDDALDSNTPKGDG